jgi:transcription antitermination factor NusA-like protein
MELVRNRIEAHERTVLTIKVDVDKVAAIIGKGGATINQLRQEGSGAEIEIDKDSGIIKIQSEDDDVKAKVKHAIDEIVLANQILNVDIEKSMISLMFGEPGKPLRKKISDEMNVWIGIDSSDSHVTLRGIQEKIEEAADMVKQFITENYTSEFEVELDDEPILFHGGSDNIIAKLENGHDVLMKFIKSAHTVVIRGVKENVDAALEALKRFMIGGDGFHVVKLKIPDFAVGVIIGKGGSNIAKLEKDYEGVVVDLLRSSGMLSIRGPDNAVKECRSSVITTLATIRVTDTIVVSPEQRDGLARPEVMKKITDGLGAQITLSDHSVKIRGIPTDVKDAKALVMEQLNGRFEATVDLEPSQLGKVSKAVKDFNHFQRITEMSKADLALDTLTSAIVISGKRGNVKKAKNQLFGFLDFLLPSEFARVKVTRALLRKAGDPVNLAKIAADTGASVIMDRELGCIQARSTRPDEVKLAVEQINERIIECEKLNYVLRLENHDSWLLPKIIGKGGAIVQALQSDTGCSVDIYKDEFIVAVSGEDEEKVAAAKLYLDNIIEKARRECVFIDIPDSAMSAFIGKSGANIKRLAETNGVEIERMRKDPSRVRIQGDEVSVQAGKLAIMQWVKQWESKNIGISLNVDKNLIPVILGKQGSNVNAIQQETGCRIDIDRRSSTVTVRGASEASKNEAMAKIKQTIQDEKDREETKRFEKEAKQKAQAEEEAAKRAAKAVAICTDTENNAKTAGPEVSRNKQHQDDGFKPIDRSSEFAVKPVGLSSNGSSQLNKVLANGKRNKKKVANGSKEKPMESVKEHKKTQGTAAANNLFQMLVSDTQPIQSRKDEHESLGSETQSSADDISAEPVTQPKTFYKSASGFSIRL